MCKITEAKKVWGRDLSGRALTNKYQALSSNLSTGLEVWLKK
jgi:hypothetical protein